MMSTSTSPAASAFLRTAATLEGLGRQLVDLKDEDQEEVVCCCGSTGGGSSDCGMWRERGRMEDKLKLSGGEFGRNGRSCARSADERNRRCAVTTL